MKSNQYDRKNKFNLFNYVNMEAMATHLDFANMEAMALISSHHGRREHPRIRTKTTTP